MSTVIIPARASSNWAIWWDIRRHPGTSGWSTALAPSAAGAMERAQHFLKLGFIVYAIRDPAGALFMDEEQIANSVRTVSSPAPPAPGPISTSHRGQI